VVVVVVVLYESYICCHRYQW